jgi:small GTP-binding protein
LFSFINGKTKLVETSTQGVDNVFRIYRLSDGSIVNVKIYDTAGQEVYKTFTLTYYRNADACLLVYDITNENSYNECKNFYTKNIKEKCKKNIKVILLGNKTDLEKDRKVASEEAASFANQNDYNYLETSCLKNSNVADAFETLIELTNLELKKNGDDNENYDYTAKGGKSMRLEKGKQKDEESSGCPC